MNILIPNTADKMFHISPAVSSDREGATGPPRVDSSTPVQLALKPRKVQVSKKPHTAPEAQNAVSRSRIDVTTTMQELVFRCQRNFSPKNLLTKHKRKIHQSCGANTRTHAPRGHRSALSGITR